MNQKIVVGILIVAAIFLFGAIWLTVKKTPSSPTVQPLEQELPSLPPNTTQKGRPVTPEELKQGVIQVEVPVKVEGK